ncbi:MAG: radical SAM protein [Thermodesulfobacteriota bacterium]
MNVPSKKVPAYEGFEQGPIRPPSEAGSLLIRVTRNCPWNRCGFCPVYKGERFSLRPVDHVIRDIDMVHAKVEQLRKLAGKDGYIDRALIAGDARLMVPDELQALNAALNWMAGGMESIFLQDANSLIIKPRELITILRHLRNRFPWVKRVTSYARSHTIARIGDDDLAAMAAAGLNRIHIGLESGADAVLQLVQKGTTRAEHILAGRKVKKAGMELSEYVMPGLGGKALSEVHARETAAALSEINPDFIRLRSLAIPNNVPLYAEWESGRFEKCSDVETAAEILLFIENLAGVTSMVKSDHILNLFEEVQGRLPGDREKMLGVLRDFLALPKERQMLYQVGRRLGLFSRLRDMEQPHLLHQAGEACRRFGITPETVDAAIDELMKRFI